MNWPMSAPERAADEWARYLALAGIQDAPPLRLLNEYGSAPEHGFRIECLPDRTEIAASSGAGLLHGVFALIRRCKECGDRLIPALRIEESAAFELRMLWSWSRIASSYRHAPYLNFRSLINPDTMADPESSAEMMRFIRNMAGMGVNALAVTHELHHAELDRYDQHGFRPFYAALRAFSEYLDSWGIELFLYTASAPEADFKSRVANTDCSFDPRVEAFYGEFIDELSREVPGIGGLLLAGGLGGYAGGSLYDCACGYCAGKTPVQRIRRQIETAAGLLATRNKRLVYTVTTDLPFTMDREVDAVLQLMDGLPDNVILSFKDCYHDFEELRYPEHPLFSRLEQHTSSSPLPLAVEYQLFPEMRGKGILTSSIAGVWQRMFSASAKLKMRGVIGVIETHPDNAHPSMSDWYAWGRLCYDPGQREDALLSGWAAQTYPERATDSLVQVLKRSFHAAGKLVYAKGVQCGSHGMIIPLPHFVRDILNDTWCPGEKQPESMIGSDLRQVFLYEDERRRQIEADPELELFLHAKRVDDALIRRLLTEKQEALGVYQEMANLWAQTETAFEAGDYRYSELMRMLRRNVEDAQRFYAYMELFLNWQGGCLSGDAIDDVRRAHVGTGADCSINTCDALLDAFLTHLQWTIEGVPFDKRFDCVYDLPQYDKDSKLWQVESLAP